METPSETPLDLLWREYSLVFKDFDDLTLARWMAQTLGQLEGKVWRLSHPLMEAYRLAAQVAHQRQIWLQRLVALPAAYAEAPCCRAPALPLVTRDVTEAGLICQHCHGTLLAFEEVPAEVRGDLETWAHAYAELHEVAHWDEARKRQTSNYDDVFETVARKAEQSLRYAAQTLAPRLLDAYPAVVWEDQDECLEVRPEDVLF